MKISTLYVIVILLMFLITACQKNSNLDVFDDAVVESSSNPYKFSQIAFVINIKNETGAYLILPQIDSIKLKVNGKYWGNFSSQEKDTTFKTDFISNNLKFSYTENNFMVLAPYLLNSNNLETAGDFVNYLQNRIVLTPGGYICEISEIKFHNINNQWVINKPQVYKDFNVIANTTSSFVGEIDVVIK